jgi:hypothetical protein
MYDVDRVLCLVRVMDNAPPVRRPITVHVSAFSRTVLRDYARRYPNRSIHFIVR